MRKTALNKVFTALAIVASSTLCTLGFSATPAQAGPGVQIARDSSTTAPDATNVTDMFTFAGLKSTPIRCVKIVWSAKPDGTGQIPGFNATPTDIGSDPLIPFENESKTSSSATVSSVNAAAPSSTQQVIVSGLTNGSIPNVAYFVTFTTFTDTACSPANKVDNVQTVFMYTPTTTVSLEVEPTMTFSVTPRSTYCALQTTPGAGFKYTTPPDANHIDLGRINSSVVGQGAHDLTVATNAGAGAAVYVRGQFATNNLRSASATPFPDTAGPPIAGTANFTYTVSNPHLGMNTNWQALSDQNAEAGWSSRLGFTSCIGFSAASAANTPAGFYNATVFYSVVPRY